MCIEESGGFFIWPGMHAGLYMLNSVLEGLTRAEEVERHPLR